MDQCLFFSAFYSCMSEKESQSRHLLEQSGLYYLADGMKSTGVVSDDNRVAFYNTFGVTPWEQVLIEKHYKALVRVPTLDGPTFGRMLPM